MKDDNLGSHLTKDKKVNLKCPRCGDWEEISKSDYYYMTLGDVVMCTKCLDKFNKTMFYGGNNE